MRSIIFFKTLYSYLWLLLISAEISRIWIKNLLMRSHIWHNKKSTVHRRYCNSRAHGKQVSLNLYQTLANFNKCLLFRPRPVCPRTKNLRWCVLWTPRCPLDDASFTRRVPWTRRPWTLRLWDDAPLRRCFLTDGSLNIGADYPYAGVWLG